MDGIDSGVKIPPIKTLDQGIAAQKVSDKDQQRERQGYRARPKAVRVHPGEEEQPADFQEKHLIDVIV